MTTIDFVPAVPMENLIRSLRDDMERARRIAVALEQECAAKDARIREADRWLDMAATYATSENVAAAIDDAAAALRGES